MSPALLFADFVPLTIKPAAWELWGRGSCSGCPRWMHSGAPGSGREQGDTSESLKANTLAFLDNLVIMLSGDAGSLLGLVV